MALNKGLNALDKLCSMVFGLLSTLIKGHKSSKIRKESEYGSLKVELKNQCLCKAPVSSGASIVYQ